MNRNLGRGIAAGVGAVALVSLGLPALAADTVPNDGYNVGTVYLASGTTGDPVSGNGPFAYDEQTLAMAAPADLDAVFPIPSDATGAWTFIAPQGSESSVAAWNAKAVVGLTPGGISLPNVTPIGQGTTGTGSPAGTLAVQAAGGDYSLGLAFTKANGVTVVNDGLYYVHIHVTPGSGAWTYSDVAVAQIGTTTTVSVPSPAPAENAPFDLAASIAADDSSAVNDGQVEFFDGSTSLGVDASVVNGAASLTVAGLPGGSHSITAVYSGGSVAGSTSAPVDLTIAGTPIPTTTTLTATSASGMANEDVAYDVTVYPNAEGTVALTALKAGATVPVSLGSIPIAGGTGSLTSAGLPAGDWTITASFTGASGTLFEASEGTTTISLEAQANAAVPDDQTVVVKVPEGKLEITTPWTADTPLDLGTLVLNQASSTYELQSPVVFASASDQAMGIQISDTRVDSPAFTAQVASTDFTSAGSSFPAGKASLINLAAHEITGNAFDLANFGVQPSVTLANTAQTFAQYSGTQLGSVWVSADMDIKGVPSSVGSGTYTATVTFTAF